MRTCAMGPSASLLEFSDDELVSPSALRRLRDRLLEKVPQLDVALGDQSLLIVGMVPPGLSELVASSLLSEGDAPREHSFLVHYDGLDLNEVAVRTGMSTAEVIECHSSARYEVRFPGFMPGFAYLGGLPRELRLPRRASPRPRVSRGTMAIAADYCGIYPHDGPGGWNLLGRVLDGVLFDIDKTPPALLGVGDAVRFIAVTPPQSVAPLMRPLARVPENPALRILLSSPLTTIQDGGRRGFLGAGLPPSGALDPERYFLTTRAVGSEGSAAIEVVFGTLQVEALADVRVALDGENPRFLRAGDSLTVEDDGALCRYLAIEGGFDVPWVLGSRSTHLSAKLGGFLGRGLRPGDVLGRAKEATSVAHGPTELSHHRSALRLYEGPDFERFSKEARRRLVEDPFTISSTLDRTGTRLGGATLGENDLGSRRSIPMVRGAMQVTPEGTPIVLGPDHPTTGGYPVVAVLHPDDFGALGRLRPGAEVRFVLEESKP